MAWAIVSSEHASSRFHVDTGGLATASMILTGAKYWVVSRDLGDNMTDSGDAPKWRNFYGQQSDTEIGEEERFEGVVLGKGTTL